MVVLHPRLGKLTGLKRLSSLPVLSPKTVVRIPGMKSVYVHQPIILVTLMPHNMHSGSFRKLGHKNRQMIFKYNIFPSAMVFARRILYLCVISIEGSLKKENAINLKGYLTDLAHCICTNSG